MRNKTFVSVGRAQPARHSTHIFGKISYVLLVRVKISCFYQELQLEFSLYRPKNDSPIMALYA